MSTLRKNIVANLVGKGWSAFMSLAFVPVYIKFLGIESYGLIGIFVMMQTFFSLLDLGLGVTVNREMARLSTDIMNIKKMRDLLRTMEIVYWAVAIIIILVVIIIDPLISHYWLKPKALSVNTIYQAILLMGVAIGVQWPGSLYSGGLIGLQKQRLLSSITALFSTIKPIGAILVLWLMAPTIQAFLIWQVTVGVLQTVVFGLLLWGQLHEPASIARFDKKIFLQIWRFAAGMSGISIMSVIVTQTDKIILSNMLSLKSFGYYTLAGTLASGVYYAVNPIFSAIFPNFSQLVKQDHINDLRILYHKGTQLIVVIIFPVAIFIAFFSYNILLLWTHNHEIARNTWLILCMLIVGNTMNGLMHIPYAVQLAYGWVKIPFYTNLVGTLFLMPAVFYATSHFGGAGAASAWVIFNIIYVFMTVWIMDKQFLKEGMGAWLIHDVGIPLGITTFIVFLIKQLLLLFGVNSVSIILLIFILLFAYLSAMCSLSSIRGMVVELFNKNGLIR